MSPFTLLVLCAQACLINTVYSQCLGGIGPLGYGPGLGAPYGAPGLGAPYGAPGLVGPGWGAPAAAPWGAPGCGAAYGGSGAGIVAVAGELPVGGATAVTGQVPIIGGVEFGGVVPAVGAVTISGTCSCGCGGPFYYVKRGQDFLPPIERIPPPADSIFFLETSCKGSLSIRQSCAIESVARIHPNRDVYVLFSAPVPYSEKLSSISQLMEFQNIKLALLNVAEYAKGTGLDEVLAQVNKLSYWPMEHTTDILKFLTLYKYGGVYIDTDMLVVKPLDDLGKNWVARQDTDLVNGAVVAIGQDELGKEFSEGIIDDIKRNYNPAVWVSTESDKLLGALMRLCNASSIQLDSFSECHGMQIYEPDMFFPVPYLKVASYFLPGGLSADVIEKAYAHHFWNEDTRLLVVRPGAPYQELAEKHCPTVVGLGDYFDGSV